MSRHEETEKKPLYKRWWFWLIVIVIVVAIGAGTSSTTNTEEAGASSAESSDTSEKTQYTVGETYGNKTINLTFVSSNTNFTDYWSYATVESGYKVIQAEFEFENLSDSDYYLNYGDFNCYADGYSCDAFYSVDDAGLTGSFIGNISSGKKAKGNVYFTVPSDATEITIEYDLSVWTSEKVEFVVQ